MPKYEFSLILDVDDVSDEQADLIYAAGCDDGFIATRSGVTQVNFYRESESLENAIRSAAADVRKSGLNVKRVELDPHALTSR